MPVVTDYTALLSGSYWNGIEVTGTPVIVTYSFPTSAPSYIAGIDGFTAATVSSFQAFNTAEQDQARDALSEWAAASGLIFIEVAPGQGDINFQLVNFNTTSNPSYAGAGGIGFYPFGDWNFFTYPSFQSDLDASGDVFMNKQFVSGGEVDYGTLLHEIGHAIGLKHPTEVVTNFAANPIVTHDEVLASDDSSLTIMAQGAGTAVLKQLDLDAAAFIYGASGGGVHTTDAAGANSVSTWSWNATTQTLTQTGFAAADTIRGSSVNDVIVGLAGDDRLFGLNGNDSLSGGDGNDSLFGGPGADTMAGGANDDTYYVDSASDVVSEANGQGYDWVIANVSFSLSNHVDALQLFGFNLTGTGNSLANIIYGDGTQKNTLRGMSGDDYIVAGGANDTVSGGNHNDIVWAGAGADSVTGDDGADTLNGEDGNDTINGGAGADWMAGGGDNDTYQVDDAGDVVSEDPGGGTDTVLASVNYTLLADSEVEILAAAGSGLALTGNNLANQVMGGVGMDTLDGGNGGVDTLSGGGSADTYILGAGDQIVELGGGGNDTALVDFNYTLAAQVENLTGTGAVGLSLTGNGLSNRIAGSSAADTLSGAGGKDTLDGGGGDDSLLGGNGDDTYIVDSTGDQIFEAANAGIDTVNVSVDYALGAQVENLTGTGGAGLELTGNELDNKITGSTGNDSLDGGNGKDTLDGGAGADTMAGGVKNDVYYVDDLGDVIQEVAGGGNDLVMSAVDFNLGIGSQIEHLTANSSAGLALTGNELVNKIIGGAGADTIDGGDGKDVLTGKGGSDLFVFDSALGPANIDNITDFVSGLDALELASTIFNTLNPGALSAAEFHIGASATDAAHRIVYDDLTGKLYFDADGLGGTAQIQFAGLNGAPTLDESDFVIV